MNSKISKYFHSYTKECVCVCVFKFQIAFVSKCLFFHKKKANSRVAHLGLNKQYFLIVIFFI